MQIWAVADECSHCGCRGRLALGWRYGAGGESGCRRKISSANHQDTSRLSPSGPKSPLARCWDALAAYPMRTLLALLAIGALLRLPFVATPLESDEGGFLMVAKQWHGQGSALYTDQWVDRPPFMLLVFKFADLLGGDRLAVRLIQMALGVALVVAAFWAGRIINGGRGAVVAATVATFVSAAFAFHGFALTGESIAGTLVMISCALLLEARYGRAGLKEAFGLTVLAGILAGLAILSKQNFLDAGVFAFAFLMVKPQRTWRLILAFGTGVAIPVIAMVTWLLSDEGPGLYRMWVAMFRFRQRSLTVIEDASLAAPLERLRWLIVLAVVTGLVSLAWQTCAAARTTNVMPRLRIALVAMLAYVVFSIAAGASWWTHYLLQLGPVLAMGAALASRRSLPAWRNHGPTTLLAIASTVGAAIGVQQMAAGELAAQHDFVVADFLKSASEPGDTVVLAYGSPSIIEESGLTTNYRYAWSLPVRIRDAQLLLLVDTLNGPEPPTWLVEIGDFDWWGLDTPGFEAARRAHYRLFANVCGHDVYLHVEQTRQRPPAPAC